MNELFEKGYLAGLGLLDLSQEKLKKVLDDLVARGEVSREQGSKMLQGAMERGAAGKVELEKKLQALLEATITRMHLATRADIERLEKRLAALEGAAGPAAKKE